MAHLIDKDALVAEIERQISAIDNCPKITNTQISVLEGDKVVLTKLLSFIDTLEMKEGDSNDAFIEKATLWLTENASDYCILHNSYDTKELIEDFITAMKRE